MNQAQKYAERTGLDSWRKHKLISYCQKTGCSMDLFIKINKILKDNGFDNWHQREQHSLPEIIKSLQEHKKKQKNAYRNF